MLGISALAQLALAQLPRREFEQAGGPAWRRWLAQKCADADLNIAPTNDLIRDIIHHMLKEACELFPEMARDDKALFEFLPAPGELPIKFVVEREEDGTPVIVLLPDRTDDEVINQMLGDLRDDQAVVITLPIEGDDSDAELEAILFASIH